MKALVAAGLTAFAALCGLWLVKHDPWGPLEAVILTLGLSSWAFALSIPFDAAFELLDRHLAPRKPEIRPEKPLDAA